ncbi:hypothetical protein CANCADRAFT_3031 [Tortispora caseinolytica NRRL Y-17796]|uniref:DUF962 domain-containing protein n=1 Tax=Tortispora caseinolytica NRRL Y-17796 TaxID=767744 RepID=A0A1E4THV6_9ASCO|nr:hypothetical protein CANCADRAFT_3031 [Tortispora caseinolytica NRRL Y-17796]
MGAFNIEDQLTFYGSYHNNKVNVLIHIICVPMILASSILMLSNFVLTDFVPQSSIGACIAVVGERVPGFVDRSIIVNVAQALLTFLTSPFANAGFLVAVIYSTFYCALDFMVGLMSSLALIQASVKSVELLAWDSRTATKYALIVHIACWIAQFIGHGVFEGRSPALFDSLLQSLTLAPFFVVYEILFSLGYRRDLHKRVMNRVGKNILQFRKAHPKRRKE